MKHNMLTVIALSVVMGCLCLVCAVSANPGPAKEKQKTDARGHVLTDRWNEFYTARKADKPQDELSALEAIIQQAEKSRLSCDFLDAWQEKVKVESSRNWKMMSVVIAARDSALAAFNEPIINVVTGGLNFSDIAGDSEAASVIRKKLLSAENRGLYRVGIVQDRYVGKALLASLENDYQYALWYFLDPARYYSVSGSVADSSDVERFDAVLSEVVRQSDGKYPQNAIAEYVGVSQHSRKHNLQERSEAFAAYSDKWAGTAASLLGGQRVLRCRADSLARMKLSPAETEDQFKKAQEQRYLALYEDCKAFEKQRSGFSVEERLIADNCVDAKNIIEQLEDKALYVSVKDDSLVVFFRNIKSAILSISVENDESQPIDSTEKNKSEEFFSEELHNAENHFYVQDSLTLPLPVLDDGNYIIKVKSGKVLAETSLKKYSLSAAFTHDASGWKIFAADCKSGKPLEQYDIKLYRDGKLISHADGFRQNTEKGMSVLPDTLVSSMDNGSFSATCSYRDENGLFLSTEHIYLYDWRNTGLSEGNDNVKALIFHDCGIYHRRDTVHCKAVLYTGNHLKDAACVGAGVPMRVNFVGKSSRCLLSVERETDQFGAVSADFIVPSASFYDGNFIDIEVTPLLSMGNKSVDRVVVDDFVLPELTCSFEKIHGLYFPGDTLEIKGKVSSYSGAPVKLSNAFYESADGKCPLEVASDGTFVIKTKAPSDNVWRGLDITVTVASVTGSTQQFTRHISLPSSLNPEIVFTGDPGGTVCGADAVYPNYEPHKYEWKAVKDSSAEITVKLNNADGVPQKIPYEYVLSRQGNEILHKSGLTGGSLSLPLSSPGEYELAIRMVSTNTSGVEYESERLFKLVRYDKDSDMLESEVENLFVPSEDVIAFDFGASRGPVWAVASLYGGERNLLWSGLIFLNGKSGQSGSLMHFKMPYKADYPESVIMKVMYFRNSNIHNWGHEYRRTENGEQLSLEAERFEDTALPGTEYRLRLKSSASSQAVVTVFDKSSETLRSNAWNAAVFPLESVVLPGFYFSYGRGVQSGIVDYPYMATASGFATKAVMNESAVVNYFARAEAAYEEDIVQDVRVRSDFATTLCWEPYVNLKPATKNGKGRVSDAAVADVVFRTSDKLGTFVVQVFAHDKNMRSAVLRKEITVTMPVQVTVAQPQILSVGDRYVLKAALSALSDTADNAALSVSGSVISGTMVLDAGPFGKYVRQVTVIPGTTADVEFPLEITADAVRTLAPADGDSEYADLPLKVSFVDSERRFSDAVLVHVPVRGNMQTLTEAHSAVVLAGEDREDVLSAIRKKFVNTSSYGAEYKEIRIIDMVREALGDRLLEPVAKKYGGRVAIDGKQSSLSLMECLCTNVMFTALSGWTGRPDSLDRAQYSELMSTLKSALGSCQKSDGGYAWYEDMSSSPLVTATILERNVRLAKYTDNPVISGEALEKAVDYLDKTLFSKQWEYDSWCSWSLGISLPQYLYVRSFYPYIPFDEDILKNIDRDGKKAFSKAVSSYLCPKDARGLNGQVFAKAIRLNTLRSLIGKGDGLGLVKSLGVGGLSQKKLKKSFEADAASLVQYVSTHPSGGMYCPNLVMPFRGLLASEAYCHSLLCDLMQDVHPELSDGIRLWLMVQKETQQWDRNFEFVNAMASVLEGSESLKQTSVTVMSKTYQKPYSEFAAAGNGFRISRSYTAVSADGKKFTLNEGDSLKVGDRITAEYRIFNAENRSFVHVTVPRPGCLRPVNQLSGYVGGALRQLGWNASGRGGYFFTPNGFRNVRSDRTEYHFDMFPEEESVLTEEYFVTQKGCFTAPVLTVESQYAPHYRANATYDGAMLVK